MNTTSLQALAPWHTAALDELRDDDLAPALCALDHHLGLCQSPHRHLFALHCMAQGLQGFVRARIVTTALLLALLIGVITLAF
jgi:hypothetical protein